MTKQRTNKKINKSIFKVSNFRPFNRYSKNQSFFEDFFIRFVCQRIKNLFLILGIAFALKNQLHLYEKFFFFSFVILNFLILKRQLNN